MPSSSRRRGFANELAVATGPRDQLVSADQRGNHHPRDHRAQLFGHEAVQDARRTLPGRGEVDVGIRVVDRHPVDLAQHAVGQDPVQIERNDDRDVVADDLPGLRQQVAFRVELAVGAHRAVQRKIDAVDARLRAGRDRLEHLAGQTFPACRRQQAGRAGACAHAEDRLRPRALQRLERAAQRGVPPEMAQHLVAVFDVKILVARRQRIERRDFLHALDDQDAGDGFTLVSFRTSMVVFGQMRRDFRPPPAGTPSGGRPRAWSRAGSSARQRGSAYGQRLANRQPTPIASGVGMSPRIGTRGCRRDG